jgi:malonyl-CoA/methylmalonyl-CoA synthetase
VVPVNTAYTVDEVRHVFANVQPSAAIVDDPGRAKTLLEIATRESFFVADCDVDLPNGQAEGLDAIDGSSPALICHTSGTTGAPKGTVLTSANLLASAESVRLAWRWEADDRLALGLPLFHLHGLGVGVHGSLVSGATIVLTGPFSAESLTNAIESNAATMFFGVPTMYHRIASSPVAAAACRALRLCVSGSAPLPGALHEHMCDVSGQAILERYGMTETIMNISNPYDGDRRPGTIGFPLPGVDIRLSEGSEGEILVRGPNVFEGYWNNKKSTDATFTQDGWFKTGDLAIQDAEGYYSIVGRIKDLIISGGYNVHPREVEDVLFQHSGVRDAAVVGRHSDEWGETVVAYVVRGSDVSEEQLYAHVAASLARYKQPKVIRFIDSIPRNALGKVQRDLLD